MKHRETCAHGSFIAWGNGFRYDYEAAHNTLGVARLGRFADFARLEFDHTVALDPLRFVATFEKTNQIKALTYSNNVTTDLGRTVPPERLSAIVQSAARLSRYAYALQGGTLDEFADRFCGDAGLKSVDVRRFLSRTGTSAYYTARLQTRKDNEVKVHSGLLHAVMAGLAERIVQDILAMEAGHRFGRSAQKLMIVASELATLSRIVDESFVPSRYMLPLPDPLAGERALHEMAS